MSWITDFGQGAAQQAAGGIFGLAMGGASNKQQFRQQKKLTRLQIDAQKQMTDYNYGKQMQMWMDTNYSAQMEQLKKAGLNPGLLYGMGGGGGQSTAVATGNVGGGQAANHAGAAVGMGQTMAQLGLMRAQKENIEADTANKQADTANKPLQGKNIEASTSKLIQETDNAKVQKELMNIQVGIDTVRKEVAQGTKDIQISQVYRTLEIANETLDGLVRENQINETVKQERIDIVKAELVGIGLQNALLRVQKTNTQQQTAESKKKVEVMDEQMNQWVNEAMMGWAKIDIETKKVRLQALVEKMAIERGYQINMAGGGSFTKTYDEKKLLRVIDEIMRED